MGLLRKVLRWTYTNIKNQDLFPQSVQMTYNGNKDFKTFHSGLISTFVKLFMVVYAIILLVKLFQNKESSKTVNTIVNDVTNDQTKHYIGKSTFGVAIQLKGENPEILKDPSFFEIHFGQDTYSQNGSSFIEEAFQDIGFVNCSNIFPVSDAEFYSLGLNDSL